METLNTVGTTIVVLGIIILFHEFGHFITAKLFGIRVFIFSFGFGQRLWGFKWGDTDCRISLVPLGGYVKLEGEADDHLSESLPGGDPSTKKVALGDGELVTVQDPDSFAARPRWQRFLVYLAGPVMNAVLAVIVFTVLFLVGHRVVATLAENPVIGHVTPGSTAAAAGLQPGDEIVAIDGQRMKTWEDVLLEVALRPGARLPLRYRREGTEHETVVVSQAVGTQKTGDIGVSPLVRVGDVNRGEPADRAGIRPDDGILTVAGRPVRSFGDIPEILSSAGPGPIPVRLLRQGTPIDVQVTPAHGKIGVWQKTVLRKFGPLRAVREAVRETWYYTKQTVSVVERLLTARISPKAAVAGPLGIAQASGEAARSGFRNVLLLIATLSVSVGLLNLFPLAPLDGGHLAIIATEGVLRRDFSVTVKAWIMNAGAMVLFLLIGLVLYSDLSKTSWLGKYLP